MQTAGWLLLVLYSTSLQNNHNSVCKYLVNTWDWGLAKSFLGKHKSKFVIVIVIDYNNRILHNITRTKKESTEQSYLSGTRT